MTTLWNEVQYNCLYNIEKENKSQLEMTVKEIRIIWMSDKVKDRLQNEQGRWCCMVHEGENAD